MRFDRYRVLSCFITEYWISPVAAARRQNVPEYLTQPGPQKIIQAKKYLPGDLQVTYLKKKYKRHHQSGSI